MQILKNNTWSSLILSEKIYQLDKSYKKFGIDWKSVCNSVYKHEEAKEKNPNKKFSPLLEYTTIPVASVSSMVDISNQNP